MRYHLLFIQLRTARNVFASSFLSLSKYTQSPSSSCHTIPTPPVSLSQKWIKVTKLKLSPRLCLLVATVASIPSDVIHQKRHIQLRFSNHLSNNQRYITIRRRDNPKGELGDMGLNGVLTVAAVLLLVREVSSGF
ncbi:uncharacterized protein [Equus asinus]|uniref:uncharacterized protein isoform X8 n=1 Tax=Equus asinus TaxID=9793 RepID=UPI0038F6BB1A